MVFFVKKSVEGNPLLWSGLAVAGAGASVGFWGRDYPSFFLEQILAVAGSLLLLTKGRDTQKYFIVMGAGLLVLYVWNFYTKSPSLLTYFTTPFAHVVLIGLGVVFFVAGGFFRDERFRHTLGICAVVFSLAGAIGAGSSKPKSSILERDDLKVETTGIVKTDRPLFILRGSKGEMNIAVPSGAGTPWFSRYGNLLKDTKVQDGLYVEGVLPRGSEFLPVRSAEKRVPAWTYLGGRKGPLSPLDTLGTSILNHGFY